MKAPVLGFAMALAALLTGITQARASDDPADEAHDLEFQGEVRYDPSLSSEDIYARTQAVLSHFGVPAEIDTQGAIDRFQRMQTLGGLDRLMPSFDATGELNNFARINASRLDVYQDIGSMQIQDFSASLRAPEDNEPAEAFAAHLAAAQSNDSDLPLRGLRIAIDPGHMGGATWDRITGKWVADSQGLRISEGVINLQTAMLLERQLLALGAQTMLTHRGLRPVTQDEYQTFDMHSFALTSLREHSLTNWFTALLSVAPIGEDLFNAFQNDASFKRLFSERNRWTLYNDDDLQARVDAMRAFRPDIVLMVHYDANTHAVSPEPAFSRDATKVYVPGSFSPTELASRADRMELASHLLDDQAFRASRALAHEVIAALSASLNIPPDPHSPGNVQRIEPGVFSRNLFLLKRHYIAATAFVECAYYNDSGEFAAISDATHPMMIDGESHPYSDRVATVASALKDAILSFVQNGF